MASGLALAAGAALAAGGLQACASSAGNAGTSSSASTFKAVRSALTSGAAQSAFSSYVTASNAAARAGNRALALSLLSGVAWDAMSAQFTLARASGIGPPYTQYAYAAPTFYLPEPSPAGDPQYFVADVARTPVPGAAAMSSSGQDVSAGVQFPAGHALMLFEQPASGGPWTLSSVSQLAPGQSVPALATDSSGHVITERLAEPGTTSLVRPGLAPPLQAAVVDDGPASAASKVVASGPLTTGLYQESSSARGFAAPAGDIHEWLLEGASYSRLALRTADGGALVLYGMYLNNIVETRSALNQDVPIASGLPITVPDFVRPLLAPAKRNPRTRMETQDILSFAAIDPPASAKAAKITVIAIGGGLRYATAY